MKIFQIYQKDNQDPSNIRVVKSGVSFVAAIFNVFWALYNRNWNVFIPLFIVYIFLKSYDNSYALTLFHSAEFIAFFILAEEMQVLNFKSKGYKMVDVVYANTEDEARYKFIQRSVLNA